METLWAVLARMSGRVHWQDTLVSCLVDKLKSEVCLCAVSQSGQKVWWYATFILYYRHIQLDIHVGVPCVTQSDRGTENFNVAYAHTHIRHTLDPSLSGSIQHRWMHGHSNIRPEQMWARFRRMWVPGFESLLQKGIRHQWYDDVNVADRLVLRWLAIPWLQKAADSYIYDHNTSRRRADRHKVLPNEVPDVMFENPEVVNALDFKVSQNID